MIKRLRFTLLCFVLLSLLITGCNVTEEEAIDQAKAIFETNIETEAKKTNQETDLFHYYLPPTLKIEEVAENNLILSKSDQLFLIFSNPAEKPTSTVNYDQDQDQLLEKDPLLLETAETKGVFNYLMVSALADDEFKVIVGSGGEKGTTITDLANLDSSIETILEIVKSISYDQ